MRGTSRARSRLALVLVGLLAVTSMVAVAAPVASASRDQSRDFRGTVVSTHRHPKTVTVNTQSKGKVSFRVTNQTRYDHIKGFSALKQGLRVEVHAKHRNGGWVAIKVDRLSSHSKL